LCSALPESVPARRPIRPAGALAAAPRVSYGGTGMATSPGDRTLPAASFDSVILAAVLAECGWLRGARVQGIQAAGDAEIALSLRSGGRSRTLLISVHPRWGRLHVTGRLRPGLTPPFVQLLRGRLEGGTVMSWEAPPFERLVALRVETLEGPLELFVEIMGRHGNLILCERGLIVGALRIVAFDRARGREVLPQRPYVRPAPPSITPATVTAPVLTASSDRPAWRAVLDRTGGVGPALAWEACLRAEVDPHGRLDDASAGRVAAALRDIGDSVLAGRFSPVLYRDEQRRATAYAAFPMRVFSGWDAEASTMSAAVDAVVARAAARAGVEVARESLAGTVKAAAARVDRALRAVADDAARAEDADRLRQQGELILAYLSRIVPSQPVLEVPGFDGTPVRITLDPRLTGVENAQAYFRRYARAAAARKRLPPRRAALEREQAFLDAAATAIAQAETPDDLWEIEQDLVAAGLRRPGRSSVTPRPTAQGRVFTLPGGCQARAGRSARENERLTFERAGPDDLWMHARGMPGAHVIVTGGSRTPPDAAITAAAAIAAYYSAGRHAGKVAVDITRRRHVRKMRGGRPGQVTYTNERTLTVTPAVPVPAGPGSDV
jgi:predicted ribosome quality control (RQC) complex YloA/Tae2 family protein